MEANHIKVFVPGVRPLTDLEISKLPREKTRAAEASGATGIWIEVPCPDLSCVTGRGRITVPVKGAPEEEGKGFWLDLFCPGDTCDVYRATDLP